jgi:hypothetical protein
VILFLNWFKVVGTEIIKLFIVLIICRITVRNFNKP